LPLCDADEFVGEISAAGTENTREFSHVGFQEFLDRRILLQFLDRPPSKRKVRLLLYRWKSAWSPALRLQEFGSLNDGLQTLFRREEL
jgi:hypothetical protein